MPILTSDSPSIQHLCKADKRLAKTIGLVGQIRYRSHSDRFAFIVHEIIEQMLSAKAGNRIYARLRELCSGRISPASILKHSEDEIKGIGTARSKARAILGVAEAIREKKLDLKAFDTQSDEEVIRNLTMLRGIGPWSAKMFLIFCLDRPDVVPFEDVAFLQGLSWTYGREIRTRDEVLKVCRKWHPYASIGARYMYYALDMGLTKHKMRK
ncbi:MAG: DNA-3-methyladenine glycosylase 2 family protein [Thermotogaceae bacterium]|nr:DNA-3-methyladenine glycosylase 2 family protein [Thermotogaceae bacterium]